MAHGKEEHGGQVTADRGSVGGSRGGVERWSRAVVVGASSGIGEAVARRLAADGTRVVLVARRTELLETIAGEMNLTSPGIAQVVTCDVRAFEASQSAFGRITAEDAVDLVVYSSGIMPSGAREGFPTEEDVNAVQTNVAGAIVWLNAAAEYFLERGSGTIVGIGSVAGERGRPANPVYNATKAALATYLESLRYRLNPKGISVVTVKPGPVKTAMMGARTPPFAPTAGAAAEQIIKGARRGRRVVYIPWWLRWVAVGLKLLPPVIMERLKV